MKKSEVVNFETERYKILGITLFVIRGGITLGGITQRVIEWLKEMYT